MKNNKKKIFPKSAQNYSFKKQIYTKNICFVGYVVSVHCVGTVLYSTSDIFLGEMFRSGCSVFLTLDVVYRAICGRVGLGFV
jgi:hypothetical protein